MRSSRNVLVAAAIFFAVSPAAYADPTTVQSTTVTTTSATYVVNNDAAVIQALSQLNECYARYDRLIDGILNHSQRVDYAAMEKHADWFVEHPLDRADRNGYLAYLEQRLHLDADQEREAARIEGHFLTDAMPLWTNYQTALSNAWTAYRLSRVTRVETSTTTVQTPTVEETRTTTTVKEPQVAPPPPPAAPAKVFIRNRDTK